MTCVLLSLCFKFPQGLPQTIPKRVLDLRFRTDTISSPLRHETERVLLERVAGSVARFPSWCFRRHLADTSKSFVKNNFFVS